MKKHLLFILLTCLSCQWAFADYISNRELRATWFTTHFAIDWPNTKAIDDTSRERQKKEMTDILDKLVEGNMNAAYMQVRSLSDATYKSSYEPWAKILTGTRGKDPGYDPLEYAIQEAHNRGMELHAWVNPFRMSTTKGGRLTEAQVNDLYTGLSWKWVLTYDNGTFTGQIIDPGYPAAREYIKNVVMEIVDKYDIDEVLFVKVVKASFGQRRKMLRNSLRSAFGDFHGAEHPFFTKRAEQLSVADFVELTNWVAENRA